MVIPLLALLQSWLCELGLSCPPASLFSLARLTGRMRNVFLASGCRLRHCRQLFSHVCCYVMA